LIIGGGHVSQALATQASPVGFDIVVFEDRSEFADPALFPPGTQTFYGKLPDLLAKFPMDPDTFIVIVTRNHQQDALALRHCIRRPVAYLGMIGSRRKIPLLRREFLKAGWATADEFRRVYAPIGLDLGAITVPEIAASIVGQLIAVRRKGSAPRIAWK
jgi:xanthine dehydrogenase accessory factor